MTTLFLKGLEVSAYGLIGVFSVLFLFYLSIKVLQKTGTKSDEVSDR